MSKIRVELTLDKPVEDTRTREELLESEYNLGCLIAMQNEYLEELLAANSTLTEEIAKKNRALNGIDNKCVSFHETGPYETDTEALKLVWDIFKLLEGEV
jgi:anti-sigma-K factor RskA